MSVASSLGTAALFSNSSTEVTEAQISPRVPAAGPSLPRIAAEIGLWGSGVTAFVLLPLTVAAFIATPLILVGEMFSHNAR
jgi:hypothetical protein